MSLLWKRHYPIVLMLAAVLIGLGVFIGKARVVAYTTAKKAVSSELSGCIDNSIDLLDDTIVHSVFVRISDDDLDTMLATYQQTGDKDFFHADVTLDGVTIQNVGIRLKGNASLRTAAGGKGNGGGPGGGGMPGNIRQNQNGSNSGAEGQKQDLGQPPNIEPDRNQRPGEGMVESSGANNPMPGMDASFNPGAPGGGQMGQPGGGPMGQPGGGFSDRNQGGGAPDAGQMQAQNLSNEQSSEAGKKDLTTMNVPFKIKLDEYEKDQCYQGLSEINIRTSGTASDTGMLQEPVTYTMARLAGIPAPRAVYTGFKLNDADEKLLVISELVNEQYLDANFSYADGILYKAEMGSSLDYKGEDPSSYSKSFSQETREKEADLAPLIEFTRFLTDASDAEFDEQISNWLDVDSFATYLAVNNLLVNRDSMVDMNNNYYLYYDDEANQFSVLLWDANESLGKLGGGNQSSSYDLYYSRDQQSTRGPGGGVKNILVQRFFASEKYTGLYEQKLIEAYRKIFLSGAITDQVDEYADLVEAELQSRCLTDPQKYQAAVAKDRSFIASRLEYLQSTDLLAGVQ